jgi:hypothetical protein
MLGGLTLRRASGASASPPEKCLVEKVYHTFYVENRPKLSILLTHLDYFVPAATGFLVFVDQSMLKSIDNRFQPAVHLKLLENVSNMVPNCRRADGERPGNITGAEPPGQE